MVKTKITAFFLLLSLTLCMGGPIQSHHAAVARLKAAGGGGGSWSPSDLASLKRWIKADALGGGLSDGDPISTAADSSGNGNTLTQTGGARPVYEATGINGLPSISFTAASSQSLDGSAVTASAVTYAVVFQPVSPPNEYDVFYTGTSGFSWYTYFGTPYFGHFRSDWAAVPTGTSLVTSGTIIIVGVSSASTYQTWINNVTEGATTAAFTQGSTFQLGTGGDVTLFFNGYIGEFIMFDSDIGSTDRTNLYNYLNDKWN